MNKEDETTEATRKLIVFLEVARKSDYVNFHGMVDGESLEEIINLTKREINWNDDDKRRVDEIAEYLGRETAGKTIKEKSQKLAKILKTGALIGFIGLAAAGGVGLAAKILNNNNGKDIKGAK